MMAHNGGFSRLLEILLPRGGGVLVMLEGYFDESGSFEEEPGVFCISGYLVSSESAKAMDRDWGAVLDKYGIPYFHMVDCAHGNGPFKGKTFQERDSIVRELIALIKRYTYEGFSVLAEKDDFQPTEADGPDDVYSHCAEMAIINLRGFLQISLTMGDFACFFETGHESANRAYNHVAKRLKDFGATLTFADKKKVRLLQAADLLAWQHAKYVKDRISQKRPPRKDFLSLMEHQHTLFYTRIKDGEKSGAVEAFPLHRRSAVTTSMHMQAEDPLMYFFEGDSKKPILPVLDVVGATVGGGKTAQITFKDFKDREFAISFDDLRLSKLVDAVLQGMAIYALDPRPLMMMLAASRMVMREINDARILHIILANGVQIAFHIDEEAFQVFKKSLDDSAGEVSS